MIHRSLIITGILMIALHSLLPTSIEELAGNTLTSTNGCMEWLKNAIHIFGADGFGLVIAKKMIPSGEAADDDDIFPASSGNPLGAPNTTSVSNLTPRKVKKRSGERSFTTGLFSSNAEDASDTLSRRPR